MPNRVIKESINESSGLSMCSLFAQDLYKRLITYADDYGRFNADTMIMLARLYPREIYSISEQDVLDGLIELAGVGKIGFYRPNVFNQYGKSGIYGAFPKWGEHQRLRDSRQKCPDPEDTSVNDWYLRRFIPMDLKRAVLERDKMKCSICGKYVTSCQDVTRFLKLGAGLYHIDHIIPVLQGGRATLENLRLTCPDCNLKRKKKFTFSEILEETINGFQSDVCGESQQAAESCSNPPPESESNPNPNPNPNPMRADALEGIDGELRKKLEEWLRYKSERRESYKPTGLHSLVEQVKKHRKDATDAQICALIDESMANGWRGIIWDRLKAAKPANAVDYSEEALPF